LPRGQVGSTPVSHRHRLRGREERPTRHRCWRPQQDRRRPAPDVPSQGSNISGLPVDPRSPRSKGQGLVARWAVAQRIRDVAVNVVGTHLQNLVIPQRVALVAAEGAPELSAERPVWCGVGTKSSASAEGPGAPMSSTVVPCLSAAGPTIIAIKVEVVSIVSGVPNCALHVAIGGSVVAHRRCTGRCRSSDEQRNRSFNGPSNHPSRISRGTFPSFGQVET
jgi:hypothetical protein